MIGGGDVTQKNVMDNFDGKAVVSTKTQENAMQNNVHDQGKTFS